MADSIDLKIFGRIHHKDAEVHQIVIDSSQYTIIKSFVFDISYVFFHMQNLVKSSMILRNNFLSISIIYNVFIINLHNTRYVLRNHTIPNYGLGSLKKNSFSEV